MGEAYNSGKSDDKKPNGNQTGGSISGANEVGAQSAGNLAGMNGVTFDSWKYYWVDGLNKYLNGAEIQAGIQNGTIDMYDDGTFQEL